MNTLRDLLKRLFSGQPDAPGDTSLGSENVRSASATDPTLVLTDATLATLMQLIERTHEGEYGCEETLDLLDEYAELEVSSRDAQALMPLVKGHLEHCVDCTERHDVLVRILEGSDNK